MLLVVFAYMKFPDSDGSIPDNGRRRYLDGISFVLRRDLQPQHTKRDHRQQGNDNNMATLLQLRARLFALHQADDRGEKRHPRNIQKFEKSVLHHIYFQEIQ